MPRRVWADWLCGDHLVTERRTVLHQFANGLAPEGHRVNRTALASVRVLGEGIDITGTVGVSAVRFANTWGSQVEIAQNIGRALRPSTDGTPKTARLFVPVFLAPGESPDAMLASAGYKPLVAVLQGLRGLRRPSRRFLSTPDCRRTNVPVILTHCRGLRRMGLSSSTQVVGAGVA